ncbi:hypothetical protein GCM10009092_39220 [Bowmanella denitrificans]|uniref:Uncharacterized protein n=1 Tax=Bowmanella denitrificans TaxID=366582 RepID=A0ABN0XRJ9_9ALTE
MDSEIESLLNFEWIPDELKDYVYDKYKSDSIYLKILGKINQDYIWVVVVYDSDEAEKNFTSYKGFEESLNQNIFKTFPEIGEGKYLIEDNFKVTVEVFSQIQALNLLGHK